MEIQRPRRIGPYEIQKQLGRGNVGIVYQARDTVRGRSVVVKVIPVASVASVRDVREFEKRFLSEGQTAAKLSHPGLAAVYDVGSDATTQSLFVVAEPLRGQTLQGLVADRGYLPWQQALRIAADVADALDHAHKHGLVHRTLTPANITILAEGKPKITDLGGPGLLVGLLSPDGRVLGDASYLSPEQALGRPADARSDLFSLGAVLYEMITGTQAFPGASGPEALAKVFRGEPAPASRRATNLPAAIDEILGKALQKVPADRYADAQSFRQDLEDALALRPPRHARETLSLAARAARGKTEPSRPAQPLAAKEGQGTEQSGSAVTTLALPHGKRVLLTILDGPRQGHVVTLTRPKWLIGRAGGGAADLEIDDSEVSRTHVLVECHSRRIVLRDLSSTNGTFINDTRITEAVIGDRTEFRVGRTRLLVQMADGA